jgi:hypothetical protein
LDVAATSCLALLQISAQVGRRSFGTALETEGGNETPLFVHQIYDGSVIHGVLTAIQGHLLVIDAVGLGHCRDRGGITGESGEVRIKARQVVLHHRRSVALGVDRDEERARAIGVGAQRAQHLGNIK